MDLIIAICLGLLGVFASVFVAAVSRLTADEMKAWMPWLTKRLIERALRRLPESQRERLGEEWLSHLNEIPGDLGKLVAALGFQRAARTILADLVTEVGSRWFPMPSSVPLTSSFRASFSHS